MSRKFMGLFFFLLAFSLGVKSAQQSDFIEVEVSRINCKNGPCLLIKYSNKSSLPIRTFKGAMPWVDGSLGIQLFGYVGVENATQLKQIYGMSGDYEEMEIAAKEEVSGEINLRDRFPDLANELRKRPILIFWRYQPVTTELKAYPPINGFVGFDAEK